MSQKTLKLEGYQAVGRPKEDEDIKWWRQWLVEIVYGLYHEKMKLLAKMGFPPRPIHQKEIFKEVQRRISMMKDENIWRHKAHGHNWVERRINECATEELGPKENGKVKVVNTTGGFYEPNPEREQ